MPLSRPVSDDEVMAVDERAPFLVGLAEDVIDHADCEHCKVNAAMGLAALGHLDDFLARTGHPDPRPPEVPFGPKHSARVPSQPADPSAVYEFRLRVIAPDGLTRDEVERLLNQLSADFGAAVVSRDAALQDILRTRARPRPWDPSVEIVPPDDGGGATGPS